MQTSSTNGNVQTAGRVSDHEKRIKTLERRSSRFSNMQCAVFRSTNQSLPNNTGTLISFDSVQYDPSNLFVIGTPTFITIPVSGFWHMHGCIRFAAQALATGLRQVAVVAGGVMYGVNRQMSIAGEASIMDASAMRYLTAGTQVGLQAFHTFGVAINAEAAASYSPYFELALLS